MTYAGFDWIIPIIIIVVYVLQILTKRKPKNDEPPVVDDSESGSEWDELMEALGQKPSSTKTEEAASDVPPVIQPHVSPPRRPPVAPVSRKSKPVSPQKAKVERLTELKHTPTGAWKEIHAPSAPEPEPSDYWKKQKDLLEIQKINQRRKNILTLLKNRQSTRDAIVVNEIFSPPVSLRPLNN